MSAVARRTPGIGGPLAASLLLHAAVVAPFILFTVGAPPTLPPMYRVDLIAAPPGERAVGVVRETPTPENPTKAPPRAETREQAKVAPINPPARSARPQTRATTNITKTPERSVPAKAPTAGGGETGGGGTDVATVRTEGIEFPFPGYLQNIVRQIALNFRPRNPGALKAEVFFFIRRDGSVTGFRFISRSGNFAFDLEVEGAVEAASGAFGPLPAGFNDDVLPVSFSFDPARLR
jgi:periplasmic protein TonB